ncbi:MAG: hypothetical protein M3Q44_03245 [bacterium]|nr:hypothetical protein [bacterium]
MASRLTFTADATKKGAIFVGIGLIAFVVLRYTFKTAYTLCCQRPTPTPTPYVNPAYGVLPPLELPASTLKTVGKKFNLETIDGRVPESTDSGTVYEVVKRSSGLDYQERSEEIAGAIGFPNSNAEKISNREFLFIDATDPNKKVEIDFIYYNLKYTYENLAAYVSLVRGATPNLIKARGNAVSFMNAARRDLRNDRSLLDTDSTVPDGSYAYLDPTTQESNPVVTQLQANLTKVNIPRRPINGVPIIGPYTTKSLINFTYTGVTTSASATNFQDRLLNSEIVIWPINKAPSVYAVYPFRSPQEAWEMLVTGKAIILSPNDIDAEYNIRSIYLAYYEPPVFQPYIQPVWVFEGDKPNDSNYLFRAIVPAVQSGFATDK